MAAFFGAVRDPSRVSIMDSDLSTVTAMADKVIRIADDSPWILHLEIQAWADPSLPRYNAILHERHELPVVSVALLLVPSAEAPGMTGRYRVEAPLGEPWEFAYRVVRVWQTPAQTLLEGPLALVPLAPISDVPLNKLHPVLAQTGDRIRRDSDPTRSAELLMMTGFLVDLRYGIMTAKELAQQPLDPDKIGFFIGLKEAGARDELRKLIKRSGEKKLGPLAPGQVVLLDEIRSLEKMESLHDRLFDAKSWDDVFADSES
jgi:hypothetical protein